MTEYKKNYALFNTTLGNFVVEIYIEEMPLTSSNFISLCQEGFYNNLSFHRIVKNFVAQVGCPYSSNYKSKEIGTGTPQPHSKFIMKKIQREEIPEWKKYMQSKGDGVEDEDEGITIIEEEITRNTKGYIPDEFTMENCPQISNKIYTLSMVC